MVKLGALLPLLFLAAPSLAKQSADEAGKDGTEIVVTGSNNALRDEIGGLMSVSSDQFARVEGQFCPTIMGLGEFLTPRLRELLNENARSVGIEANDHPCAPSAAVIFTDDPQALGKAMRAKNHRWFFGLSRKQRDRLLQPVRRQYAWQINRTLGRGGEELNGTMEMGTQAWVGANTHGQRPSRLQTHIVKDIGFTFLLVDVDEAEGATLGQLADYVTLHLLLPLEEDAAENARPDSMLRLLEVDDPTTLPPRMGSFDRKLLEGLYAIDTNSQLALAQRGRIADYIQQGDAAEEADVSEEP